MPPFVHLNVHSAFSLTAGACLPEALVARAATVGFDALALTDTDGAYALPSFQGLCDAAGIRAIHGSEITTPESGDPTGRAVVLVKTVKGYRSLCRLLTRRKLDERFTLEDDLAENGEGLVVLTPSPHLLAALHPVFGQDDLYGEVVAHAPGAHRRAIWEAACERKRPVVGTFRTFFTHPEKRNLHRLLLAIGHQKLLRKVVPGTVGRDGHPLDLAPEAAWLVPPHIAAKAFRETPEAAGNTVRIAERLLFRLERSKEQQRRAVHLLGCRDDRDLQRL